MFVHRVRAGLRVALKELYIRSVFIVCLCTEDKNGIFSSSGVYFPDISLSVFQIPLKVVSICFRYMLSRFKMCDYRTGIDWISGLLITLNTPLGATRNYSATPNLHTLHFTRTR
jgi:hypothetical protein